MCVFEFIALNMFIIKQKTKTKCPNSSSQESTEREEQTRKNNTKGNNK